VVYIPYAKRVLRCQCSRSSHSIAAMRCNDLLVGF
jgi:hypothetical protein